MAINLRRLPSGILNPSLLLRSLSSLSSPPLNLTAKLSDTEQSQTLNLDDTEGLFASVRTSTLFISLANLYATAFDPMVDLATAVMSSPAVMESRLGRAAVVGAIRTTVYKHFCAGEGDEEVRRTVTEMWEGPGLRSILDYAVEDAGDAAACHRNLEGFVRTVDLAAALPPTSASICIKITAICPIKLLERISDLLRWNHNHRTFNLPWKSHAFPILSDLSPLYLTPSKPDQLSDSEERELELAQQRLKTLCLQCAQSNLTLFIDAEYASVQPAIDYFTFLSALEFNREQPVVYGTVQAYLKDARERLENMVKFGENEGICVGVKLVRGAYMTRERHVADSFGAASPIHQSIQETHECYNDCANFLLDKVRAGSSAMVLATHNTESGKLAVAKAEELGIRKGDNKLQFAQLMGMANGLSLGLRNAGFNVNKYLPFGPVGHVIPYLLRRAEENKGFLSTSARDRELLRKEVTRRLKTAILGRD